MNRPLLALTIGDPSGIGPETVAAALTRPALRELTDLVVLGPGPLCPADVPRVEDVGAARGSGPVAWMSTGESADFEVGRASRAGGEAALAALALGHRLALDGAVDGLVTAPVSKEALHLAGQRVEGQTALLSRWSGTPEVEMLAVAHRLRVQLATRHMALRAALDVLDEEHVLTQLARLDAGLRRLGFGSPRIGLAGLNPHAGEGGLFGDEEARILAPARERARAAGLDVHGPVSPDTLFLQASRGEYDAVLALYHDQGFIPVKLHAPGEAVTVLLGLPYLRVSPAHGTAFDIAGRGLADPINLVRTIERAAEWAPSYRSAPLSR